MLPKRNLHGGLIRSQIVNKKRFPLTTDAPFLRFNETALVYVRKKQVSGNVLKATIVSNHSVAEPTTLIEDKVYRILNSKRRHFWSNRWQILFWAALMYGYY